MTLSLYFIGPNYFLLLPSLTDARARTHTHTPILQAPQNPLIAQSLQPYMRRKPSKILHVIVGKALIRVLKLMNVLMDLFLIFYLTNKFT